jgi:energy-coupling factor transporter ATP-binding protein EcfA2
MMLKSFQVTMYKSVIDSGVIEVSPLLVIVGKNESGKTSILKALHKLNPATADPYRIVDEWPRGNRESRSAEHAPCWAQFDLNNEEQAKLGTADASSMPMTSVRVGRTYAGKLTFEAERPLSAEAETALAAMLPKFVFMDEYEYFPGTAHLDQVQQRVTQNATTAQDKALITILTLAGLKLNEQVTAAQQADRTERQYELSDASATITKRMASHWKQLAYEIKLDADGQQFWTFVKSPGDKALIKLEERSRGFQWFFSFDAKLMHETKGDLKNTVILLDEPGLHLHASAQRDLLARLEEYAAGNTMIYTSHLPFMINLQEPDRIRVLNDTTGGPVVTRNLTESSPEAKLTLQAALGMTGRFGMPVADRNLTVEGSHDYWFITALSDLLAKSGKTHLPTDVVITACGGAPEVTYLSTFMVGQELQVAALYDSDQEGRGAKDKFVKSWLTRYNGTHAEALLVGDVMGVSGESAIEDLFPETFYTDAVLSLYRRHLPEDANGRLTLTPGGTLAKRVERALAQHNISFNKGSVAKVLCEKIRAMKSIADLPPETATRAEKLLASLAASLTKARPTSASSVEAKPSIVGAASPQGTVARGAEMVSKTPS